MKTRLTFRSEYRDTIILSVGLVIAVILALLIVRYFNSFAGEKNEKLVSVSINPAWEEYMNLPEEEKAKYEVIPERMVYQLEQPIEPASQTYENYSYYTLYSDYSAYPRNQRSLGICWAFATVASTESVLAKKGISVNNSIRLSEYQLDYASALPNTTYVREGYNPYYESEREISAGAYPSTPFRFLNFGFSPVTMDKFGISASFIDNYDTKGFKEVYDNDNVDYSVTEYHIIPTITASASASIRQNWVNQIKQHVYDYGGVTVSTEGPNQSYAGSCYYNDTANSKQLLNVDGNCNPPNSGAHMMTIIGWDDNYTYNYCRMASTTSSDINNCSGTIVSGQGAFILKNSWGTSTPFPYLSYKSVVDALYGVVDAGQKDWDKSYVISESNTHNVSAYSYEQVDNNNNGKDDYIVYLKDPDTTETLKRVSIMIDQQNINADNTVTVYVSNDGENYTQIGSRTITLGGYYSFVPAQTFTLDNDYFYIKTTSTRGYVDRIYAFTTDETEGDYPTASIVLESDRQNVFNTNALLKTAIFTRNIPTGDTLTFKLFDSDDNEIPSRLIADGNIVLNGFVDSKFSFNEPLALGNYTIKAFYQNEPIGSVDYEVYEPESLWDRGSGTVADPWIIASTEDFMKIYGEDYLYSNYRLIKNIDLSSIANIPEVTFYGSLDGGGYTIYGLQIDESWNGLFNKAKGATFKNIVIDGFEARLTREKDTGLIVNEAENTTFDNIIVQNSTIVSNGSSSNYVGGIVGYAHQSTFHYVSNRSAINISDSISAVGGLIGYCSSCTISESYNIADINSTGGYVGGLIGNSYESTITNVYNQGNVNTGAFFVGGIIGYASGGSITNTYSISSPSSAIYFGNIVGYSRDLVMTNAYMQSNGEYESGYGSGGSLNNVVSKTDDELLLGATYAGFDFSNIWAISGGYPYFTRFNYIVATAIEAPAGVVYLNYNNSYMINARVAPMNATSKRLAYSSSSDAITIDFYGNVKAGNSEGSAIVTVSTTDGTNITKEITIVVFDRDKIIDSENFPVISDDQTSTNYIKTTSTMTNKAFAEAAISNEFFRGGYSESVEDDDNVSTGRIFTVYDLNNRLVKTFTVVVAGDVMGNGKVAVSDVARLYQAVKGKITLSSAQTIAGDVFKDDLIKVSDVAKLYQYVKGKINNLE